MDTLFPELLTHGDWGLLGLRLAVGLIFLYHAWPKIQNPKMMAQMMATPSAMPMMLGLWEATGALLVLSGYHVQLGALALALVMLGAIFMKITKMKTGFASMAATGWEFDLILLAANGALVVLGPGSFILARLF